MNKLRVWFAVAMIAALAGPAAGRRCSPGPGQAGGSATGPHLSRGSPDRGVPGGGAGGAGEIDLRLRRGAHPAERRRDRADGPVLRHERLAGLHRRQAHGALAYSFPYTTDPVAGVTPFEQMRALFGTEPGPVAAGGLGGAVDVGTMLDRMASPDVRTALALPPPAGAAARRPRCGPSGRRSCCPAARRRRWSSFGTPSATSACAGAGRRSAGATGGAAAGSPPLAPGAGVVVTLVRGDIGMGAGGHRDRGGRRDRVCLRPSVPAGGADRHAAARFRDPRCRPQSEQLVQILHHRPAGGRRASGPPPRDHVGRLGARPELVPVAVTVETPRKPPAAFAVEVVRDPFLTPFLINYALFNFLQAEERAIGAATIDITAEITLAGGGRFRSATSSRARSPRPSRRRCSWRCRCSTSSAPGTRSSM